MQLITRPHLELLDAAEAIRLDPDKVEAAFMARQLVQATLPHKNPGNVPLWARTNGNLALTIQPGQGDGKLLGYPYGTIPRLLLVWMTTEAVKTKNRRLELGNSLTAFMRELGLNPDNGGTGAKRSDARRLRDQMQRLFQARISFNQKREEKDRKGYAWLNRLPQRIGEILYARRSLLAGISTCGHSRKTQGYRRRMGHIGVREL
jgi:hypothetical protein